MNIPDAVRQLLSIIRRLRADYPHKRFTLDGRLVGDLGEILVAQSYRLTLLEGVQKHHDATADDGRLVQIKATMQDALTFPADHVPVHYLGIKIHPDGTFTEIFNGPGSIAHTAVAHRKRPKNNMHSISIKALTALQQKTASAPIPRRNKRAEV